MIGVENRLQSYIRPCWRTRLRAFMESAYREPLVAAALLSQTSYRLFRVPVRPMAP